MELGLGGCDEGEIGESDGRNVTWELDDACECCDGVGCTMNVVLETREHSVNVVIPTSSS